MKLVCKMCGVTAAGDLPDDVTETPTSALFAFCLECGAPYVLRAGLFQLITPEEIRQLPLQVSMVLMQAKMQVIDDICFRQGVEVLGGSERNEQGVPLYLNTLGGEALQIGLESGFFGPPADGNAQALYEQMRAAFERAAPGEFVRRVVISYGRDHIPWGDSRQPPPTQRRPAEVQ